MKTKNFCVCKKINIENIFYENNNVYCIFSVCILYAQRTQQKVLSY